jgi:chaperone modulatory protein CbpM
MASGDGSQSARNDGGVSVETREFLVTAHLKAEALDAWIDAGWLVPRADGERRQFSEVDLARVRLIQDLQDLGINDDAIPVILDLIDQLHGLRRVLREVLSTVTAQSEASRHLASSGASATHWQERK